MDIKQALDIEFNDSDLGLITVRGYLKTLLQTVLGKGESFNGKRPFGNSGWEGNLAAPLITAGLLEGKIDEGYAYDYDRAKYSDLQEALVEAL